MKRSIGMIFILLSCPLFATNYYIKSTGSDASLGLADGSAWATIEKVNSEWAAGKFKSGDNILFRRGDTFYGTIKVRSSGTPASPIVIGAYGSGEDPVISGFSQISSWTPYNSNVYYCIVDTESSTNNMVTINGVNTSIGRWPNTGWMTYETFSGAVSITDYQLTNDIDWDAAELVFRKSWWTLERVPITSHSGTGISYTSSSSWTASAGFGYFIQSDLKTFDKFGEWHYDGDTLFMYFGTEPPDNYSVKITALDRLITSGERYYTHYDYITLDNLSFDGSNISTVDLVEKTKGWKIQNCTFNHSGKNCIEAALNNNSKIINNVIRNSNNNAIRFVSSGYGNVIRGNTIDSTGALIGMMESDDNAGDAIVLADNGTSYGLVDTVAYNKITNTGHSAIRVRYYGYYIGNNFINKFALTRNDAGGIYIWGVKSVTIKKNIILNGYGESGGCRSIPDFAPPDPPFVCVNGIYIDELSSNISVIDNTLAYNRDGGILVQMSSDVTLTGNTSFDNKYFQMALIQRTKATNPVRNIKMNNNIFFSKTAGISSYPYRQLCLWTSTYEDHDVSAFGTFDYNYYARPVDQDNVFRAYEHFPSNPWNGTGYTLAGWKTYSGQDSHSSGSLVSVTDTANIKFIYNNTTKNKVFSLSGPMKDVTNTTYSGSIAVAPFTSIILLGSAIVKELIGVTTVPVSPVFVSAAIENATPSLITMTFSIPIEPNDLLTASAFTVKVNNIQQIVSEVTVTGNKVALFLASPVSYNDIVTVAYSSANSSPLKSESGGMVSTIGDHLVVNNCIKYDQYSKILNLFPNPNDGNFWIDYTSSIENRISQVLVINKVGTTLHMGTLSNESNSHEFKLPFLKPGTYYVVITANGKVKSVKEFIKN